MGMELIQNLPSILPYKLRAKAAEETAKAERTLSQSSVEGTSRRSSESASEDSKTLEEESKEDCPMDKDSYWSDWSVEELKRMLDFQTQLFLSNFAVYVAHKVMTAHSMEVCKNIFYFILFPCVCMINVIYYSALSIQGSQFFIIVQMEEKIIFKVVSVFENMLCAWQICWYLVMIASRSEETGLRSTVHFHRIVCIFYLFGIY